MGRVAERLEGGRPNPGLIKLELFCEGLRLAPDCDLSGAAGLRRMRSGLGSGLELRLPGPGAVWVNAPVVEPFARESPYSLHGSQAGGYELRHAGRTLGPVAVPGPPAFYDRLTLSGRRMGSVGVIQGTYLGVYFGPLCANWSRSDEETCRFCSIGENVVAGDERLGKGIRDVVETAWAARAELGITFVHVNGGFDDRGRYRETYGPLMRALREETGLLLGLQIPPLADLEAYREVADWGVDNVSLCFEIWDEDRFREVCPGKSRRAPLGTYRAAIEHCARVVRFATTNGELIAGLEAPEGSQAAIDWLVGVGAVPTVCVFRPVAGTAYQHLPPPRVAALRPVFEHLYRRTMEAGLPVGVAPGVRVSIVLTPEECRWLLPPGERGRWPLRRLQWRAARRWVGWRVRRRVRRAGKARASGAFNFPARADGAPPR